MMVIILAIIAFSIPEIAQIAIAVTTIGTITIAAIRWIMKKYVISLERQTASTPAITELKAQANDLMNEHVDHNKKLDNIVVAIQDFKKDLSGHMNENDRDRDKEYATVVGLQKSIDSVLVNQDKLAAAQTEHSLSIVKGLATTDECPVLIYRTTPGEYGVQWVNQAWTKWTGLNLEETQAGGDVMAIKEGTQRDLVEPEVYASGQDKELVDVKYTMIKPKTQEEVGPVWAHGYPMHTYDENVWYYIARIKKDDVPTEK